MVLLLAFDELPVKTVAHTPFRFLTEIPAGLQQLEEAWSRFVDAIEPFMSKSPAS